MPVTSQNSNNNNQESPTTSQNFKDNNNQESHINQHYANNINPFEVDARHLQIHRNERLGSGAYGTVYRGLYYKTPVAIKELNDKQRSKKAAQLFKKEAKIISSLKHAHIVTCYCYSIDSNPPFIVMELMNERYFLPFLKILSIALTCGSQNILGKLSLSIL